ncbi:hypothetical protein CBR_g21898 [Chara braunii]|uniref:pectinesterase n=1 Tax=Chara braunii TaxID=69332 RepID=A0A388L1G5_CHABU|nr:hypothetical protein CBR_g21898 [Chara braunii]|eukprot:GBG76150.1 hypothetical protein CBR_g21898 [Chara braunii]
MAGRGRSRVWREVGMVCMMVMLSAMVERVTGLIVAKDGSGDFMKLTEALNAASPGTRIIVKPGEYREKVVVTTPNIVLIGTPGQSVIVQGESSNSAGSTLLSATFTVKAKATGFVAMGMVFKNDYGRNDEPGEQAVAAAVMADSSFYNCQFIGWQDTLYAKKGRQYYKDCYIEGSVDFAFGAATAQFVDCVLYAKRRGSLTIASYTAQQRLSSTDTNGYVFIGGQLKCDAGVRALLGRAWGKFARTVFIKVAMDNCIDPKGWSSVGDSNWGTTSFSAEYQCTGPGADRSGRVSWSKVLTDEEAAYFSSPTFLGGSRSPPGGTTAVSSTPAPTKAPLEARSESAPSSEYFSISDEDLGSVAGPSSYEDLEPPSSEWIPMSMGSDDDQL